MLNKIITEDGEFTVRVEGNKKYIIEKKFPKIEDSVTMQESKFEKSVLNKFEITEVEENIKEMKKHGAPGHSGWAAEFIEELFIADKEWFTYNMNRWLQHG
ncbi:hypothetical protein AVEN_182761-1 [Araneus ventricosus]|uniref:Uncharacterized protein n=1 Tax=Araneus ventricosus TaxID=182803 RepID=A0A4Y2V9X3_ARAVE|nr:hypothetical protein AVEN_182761-1 [Araneus ventricosus]